MTQTRRVQKRKQKAKSNKHIFKSIILVGIAVLLVAGFFGAGAVKSIIEAHGGSICVTSEEGQMIFTIELPKAYEGASVKQ